MLIPSTSELVETSRSVSEVSRGNISRISRAAAVRSLARGECLFQKGDRHARLYRVEHGALCHYMHRGDGSHEIIEFVFKGDIVGFAHLEKHITTARALVLTEVSVVPSQVFADALKTDGCLAARVAAAADREFDYLRSRAIQSGEGQTCRAGCGSYRRARSHKRARRPRPQSHCGRDFFRHRCPEPKYEHRLSCHCSHRARAPRIDPADTGWHSVSSMSNC